MPARAEGAPRGPVLVDALFQQPSSRGVDHHPPLIQAVVREAGVGILDGAPVEAIVLRRQDEDGSCSDWPSGSTGSLLRISTDPSPWPFRKLISRPDYTEALSISLKQVHRLIVPIEESPIKSRLRSSWQAPRIVRPDRRTCFPNQLVRWDRQP